MSHSCVIQVAPTVLRQMATHYQKNIKTKTPPYAEFAAKVGGTTITAYTSGKVMFQGAEAESEASRWAQDAKQAPKKKKSATTTSLPAGFANWAVMGSDEVGNGSYFGPVVVCATYVEPAQMPLLKELGVRDSKELNDTQIRAIAQDIRHVLPFQELIVNPTKYNEIQPTYNVIRMKVALHNQALYLLRAKLAPTEPQGILIDQFTPEANYRKYLAQEKQQVTAPLYFATKGEQEHLAVAAASIICRASFLDALDEATKELGMVIPSGAGTKSDLVAAKILKRGGMPLLGKYAKLHFANTKKAQQKLPR